MDDRSGRCPGAVLVKLCIRGTFGSSLYGRASTWSPAGEPGEAADVADTVETGNNLAQLAGARCPEYGLDQNVELAGQALALRGYVGGGDAGIVAGRDASA